MSKQHWAIGALRDIKAAIDQKRYDVAAFHINDAIEAIVARDLQDSMYPFADSEPSLPTSSG